MLILDGGRQGSGYLVRNRTQSTSSSNDDSSSQSDIAEVGRRDESVYEVPSNELLNNTDTSNENENENENAAMVPANKANDDDDEIDFNELYLHYVRDIEDVRASESILMKQLQEIKNLKHFEYCHNGIRR